MSRFRRSFWLFPLFQIPLMLLGVCLLLATLFWLLGWGRPNVAVVITLDLSASTYNNQSQLFKAPNTIIAEEITAVKSYIEQNSKYLKEPNKIQVLGFADNTVFLTNSFSSGRQNIETELNQSLRDPRLINKVGGNTNLNRAISEGIKLLSTVQDRCRELLVVTDGQAEVSQTTISQATTQNVKINAVVVGESAPQLQEAVSQTGGLYSLSRQGDLQSLFIKKFFPRFNSNLKWIILWLGAAWIFLMWVLTLPLDQWIFQGLMKLPMNLSGKLALGNAFFWSATTPLIIWQLWKTFGSPFFSSC
ncbi:MAG: VWA domain-containing protein [Symploca sp. SIO1C4]|uniref:VWA domain-containing protein n=1 Tax=Symploca sp. SIO1C4 TaxID=2607765 RepID=A0A6B3N2R4_9CYAN|nr:VWA domain-containing protein [Symploca sp. SIO1C4]